MCKGVIKRKEGKTLTKQNRDLCAEQSLHLGLVYTKSKNIKDNKYESQHD
jgi:hypothetical protein